MTPRGNSFDRMEQSDLANSFKTIVFIERDIESAKIDLALKSDFNLIDAFRLFDMNANGYITQQDLVDGLQRNLDFGECVNQVDIALFFKRFDRQQLGRISFNQFSEALLPFSQEFANLVTQRPDYYIRRGCDV